MKTAKAHPTTWKSYVRDTQEKDGAKDGAAQNSKQET